MLNTKTKRCGLPVCVALGLMLGLASSSWAQSAADPTGEPPIGIEEKSGTKGPGLVGVLALKLINSNGLRADSAEVTLRLRRGSQLLAFNAAMPGPLFFDTETEKAQFQEDLLNLLALREDILGGFFPDVCGRNGDQCPLVDLLLKQADEFGLTSDLNHQYVVMDVTLATSEPL